MPSDLSIGAVAQSGPSVRETVAPTTLPAASASVAPVTPGVPNPTLRLDPALGLVVIEFLSKTGTVTTSIPTQRELAAYQDGTAQLPGAYPAATPHGHA
jgi:hypothetical protein